MPLGSIRASEGFLRRPGPAVTVFYQGAKIPARHVVVEVAGERLAIETALYGGLGERTGSGFGFVFPA